MSIYLSYDSNMDINIIDTN